MFKKLFGYEGKKGLFFNPFTFNLIVRPAASFGGGLMYTSLFYMLQFAPSITLDALNIENELNINIINASNWWLFVGLMGTLIALPDTNPKEVVPVEYAACMTIFGMPFRLYRTTGRYGWTGKWILLSRTNVVMPPFTDSDGFIFLGGVPIQIWNNAQSRDDIALSSIAKDGSTIVINLQITTLLRDPLCWILNQDSILILAERTRAAARASIKFFTGRDVAEIKSVLNSLMIGDVIYTCFLQETVEEHKKGSIIVDRADAPIFVKLSEHEDETKAKAALQKAIKEGASDAMIKAVDDGNGKPFIEKRSVEETMKAALDRVGAEIYDASVGDVSFSEEVETQANLAAGEEFQALARLASAKSTAEAQAVLAEAQKGELAPDDMSRLIAAAQDNPNIKVTYVPGADSLARAAVAGASQLKGNDADMKDTSRRKDQK